MMKSYLLFAFGTLVAALPLASRTPTPPDSADALFQKARGLIGQDDKEAFKLMQQAAQDGSADAEGGLGYFYAQGIEVPKDEAKAAEYFKKGAEGGSARSQLNYAAVLLAGQGVKKDPAAALPWLEKAAAAGVPEAQERLGLAVFHGDLIDGVSRDDEKARQLLQAASEAGRSQAQNAYAFMLAEARGGSGDEAAAESWYRRAAEQDEPKAMANLGRMLFNSGAKDRARRVEGLKWLMTAQAHDEPTAKNTLAEYQVNADGAEWSEAQQEADQMTSKVRFKAAVDKLKRTPSKAAGGTAAAASPASSPATQSGE